MTTPAASRDVHGSEFLGNINAAGQYEFEGAIAVITLDSPPVNALSAAVRGAIVGGLARAHADPSVAAVVLICAGRTFIAGADIAELGKPPRPPSFEDVVAALENGPKPVIAAIHGTALGGGLETALLCHYRVADPDARMGLPEVKLGLLPGGGGTQRLPRVIGVEAALELIVTGRQVGAVEAHRLGIVDALAPAGDLRGGAIGFARAVVAEGGALTRIRDRDDRLAPARGDAGIFEKFRLAHPDLFRGFKAPDKILEAVAGAVNLPFDEGIARERALIGELMADRQFAALRYMFFAEREAGKIKDAPKDVAPAAFGTVAILGGGPAAEAAAGFFTVAGLTVVSAGARRDAAPDLIFAVAGVDLAEGLAGAGPRTVFAAAEAAALPELARVTGQAGQVIGLKFSGRLLEICRTGESAAPAVAAAMQLGRRGGKVAVLCGEAFITDRLKAAHARAVRLLREEGVSEAEIGAARYAYGFSLAGDAPDAAITAGRIDLIQAALLFPLIDEGAAMLADGTAQRASDIDAAAVLALTWPSYTGGPMFWAATIGLPRVVAGLRGRMGFEPHELLIRLAETGKNFQSEAANG